MDLAKKLMAVSVPEGDAATRQRRDTLAREVLTTLTWAEDGLSTDNVVRVACGVWRVACGVCCAGWTDVRTADPCNHGPCFFRCRYSGQTRSSRRFWHLSCARATAPSFPQAATMSLRTRAVQRQSLKPTCTSCGVRGRRRRYCRHLPKPNVSIVIFVCVCPGARPDPQALHRRGSNVLEDDQGDRSGRAVAGQGAHDRVLQCPRHQILKAAGGQPSARVGCDWNGTTCVCVCVCVCVFELECSSSFRLVCCFLQIISEHNIVPTQHNTFTVLIDAHGLLGQVGGIKQVFMLAQAQGAALAAAAKSTG